MDDSTQTGTPKTLASTITATLAAFGASLCCIGPVVLLSLGVGGSWMSSVRALEPYRPIFIIITALFLLMAFRKLYIVPRQCEPTDSCAAPASLRKQRIIFWVITIVAIALVTFPYYGLLLLK